MEQAFYLSFDFVQPANKRFFIAQDISGSMTSPAPGLTGISCLEASACLSLVTLKTEPALFYGVFNHQFEPRVVNSDMNMKSFMVAAGHWAGGSTSCSAPMEYATKHKIPVDVFAVYTDNETYAGRVHPHIALKEYRQKMGINAKMVVVSITANPFTIADPKDAGSLDVVGFDTSTPSVLSAFAAS